MELVWVLERVDASTPARFRHALLSTARNLVALDRYDEALERFNQLRELDPEDFDLYEEYSGALLSAGRPEEALEWLNRAVSLSLNGDTLNAIACPCCHCKTRCLAGSRSTISG